LLKDHTAQLTLGSAKSCPQWMLANDGSAGYYRARYAPGELARLLGPAGPRLSKAERVGLLGDAAALVTSGGLAASEALEIASGLAGDPDRQIVSGTIGVVRSLWEFVPDTQRATYAAFVRKLYGERARALGWKAKAGEAEEERLLRVTLLGIVGARGEDPVVGAEAVALTQRWLEDPRAVDPELLDTVLSIAGRFGDRPLFDRLHEELKKSEDRQRRGHLWEALGSFRNPAIVPAALQLTLEEGLDARESLAIPRFLTDDPATRTLAYDFVKQNYEALVARLPRGSIFDGGSFLVAVGGRFCDEGHRADVEAFFGPKAQSSPGAPRTLAQTLERIDLCIAQRRVLEPSLASFFREQGARGGAPQ
jgi:alanyl aminopeptidase